MMARKQLLDRTDCVDYSSPPVPVQSAAADQSAYVVYSPPVPVQNLVYGSDITTPINLDDESDGYANGIRGVQSSDDDDSDSYINGIEGVKSYGLRIRSVSVNAIETAPAKLQSFPNPFVTKLRKEEDATASEYAQKLDFDLPDPSLSVELGRHGANPSNSAQDNVQLAILGRTAETSNNAQDDVQQDNEGTSGIHTSIAQWKLMTGTSKIGTPNCDFNLSEVEEKMVLQAHDGKSAQLFAELQEVVSVLTSKYAILSKSLEDVQLEKQRIQIRHENEIEQQQKRFDALNASAMKDLIAQQKRFDALSDSVMKERVAHRQPIDAMKGSAVKERQDNLEMCADNVEKTRLELLEFKFKNQMERLAFKFSFEKELICKERDNAKRQYEEKSEEWRKDAEELKYRRRKDAELRLFLKGLDQCFEEDINLLKEMNVNEEASPEIVEDKLLPNP